MVIMHCVIEIADARTIEEARAQLDAFRESVRPSFEYGLTIYEDESRKPDVRLAVRRPK